MRASGRQANEMRPVTLEMGASRHAEGSCLITFGGTRVLCTASAEAGVPGFLKNTGKGWVTAEYGMLPRSTHTRSPREAAKGKQSGRTQEIQRLIGRSLRAVIDLTALGERQIVIDCDVIEADGGTRTASITGAYVALYQALAKLKNQGLIKQIPLTGQVAAISCGVVSGTPVLDLEYTEDSTASMDANFILTPDGRIIEIQCTAEESPVQDEIFAELFNLARKGVAELAHLQKKAIESL